VYEELNFFDKSSKLLIGSRWPLDKMKILDEIDIVFFERPFMLIIGQEAFITIIEEFIRRIFYALKNELLLDESCYNIGLVANQYDYVFWIEKNNDRSAFKHIRNTCWIGYEYKLFAYKSRISWLYNDRYGNIVLEVTPWFNVYKCKDKAIYKQWIKNYKPILKRTIAPEIAQKWIKQMEKLLNLIRVNSGIDSEYDFMNHSKK
jgi:hypothetical protein